MAQTAGYTNFKAGQILAECGTAGSGQDSAYDDIATVGREVSSAVTMVGC